MTYQSVWWHDPIEYGAGLNGPKTWPNVMEQYRRPVDLRYYDLPVQHYDQCKLYYERRRMGKPTYRGTFRDKPHTVPSYYPEGVENKPTGFHGRIYYEQDGPTQFKYNGWPKNDLYWLENKEFQPVFSRRKPSQGVTDAGRGLNETAKGHEHPSQLHLRNISTKSRTSLASPSHSSLQSAQPHSANPMTISRTSMSQPSQTQMRNLSTAEKLNTFLSPSQPRTPVNRMTMDGPGYL